MRATLRPASRTAGPATALACLLASVALACGGSSTTPDAAVEGPLHIEARPESVAIKPGESRQIAFRLLDEHGTPVPDRVMQVSIVDDPATKESEARGATLSFDRSITDSEGTVVLQVIAGLPTIFRVRASAMRAADANAVVFVNNATHGAAEIVPTLADQDESVTTVRLFFYDDGDCAHVSVDEPAATIRPVRVLPIDGTAVYSSINTDGNHPVLGLGVDAAGRTRLGGCVDLPGASLLAQDTVRVALPLRSLPIAVEGRYRATSTFKFREPPLAGAGIPGAWKDLSGCALDPARLWLDCTIDAFAGDKSTDPLDCRPGTDEGPIGNKLAARRGVLIPTPVDGTVKCRQAIDVRGARSHDAIVGALFPASKPPLLAGLADLGREAGQLVAGLRLQSTIALSGTSLPGQLQAEHRASIAEFTVAGLAVPIDLLELGVPAPTARFVPVVSRRKQLDFSTHGFTLRLGSAARAAFVRASLRPRAFPVDPTSLVTALFNMATYPDKAATQTGCAALDAVLCPDVGEARGCLLSACAAGLGALAKRLDAGFTALDGDDIDLLIGGTVPVLDRDGDRTADALGATTGVDGGLWSGEIRARGGNSTISGTWMAERTRP